MAEDPEDPCICRHKRGEHNYQDPAKMLDPGVCTPCATSSIWKPGAPFGTKPDLYMCTFFQLAPPQIEGWAPRRSRS